MGLVTRYNFPQGWQPSVDAVNAPPDGLLRMDNLVLDELGALALRLGSSKIMASALATTDIRSLYSTILSGTRYRMAQGGGTVYRASGLGSPSEFLSIQSGFDTALDVQFASYLGQIFFASGTVKKKYDGSSVRNWGIAAPTTTNAANFTCAWEPDEVPITFTMIARFAFTQQWELDGGYILAAQQGLPPADHTTTWEITHPSPVETAPSNKVFASCDSGETTWTDNESAAAATNVNGFDGTANGARQIQASATTFRGVMSRDIGSITNFTDYGSGVSGSKDDVVELYVKIDEPEKVDYITLTVDLKGTAAASFDQDYMTFTWLINKDYKVTDEIDRALADDYDAEGYERKIVRESAESRPGFASTIRPEPNGWHYLSAKRSQFQHVRTSDDRFWDTVRGVRVAFGGSGQATIAFDRIRMIGGKTKALTGTYVYRAIYVREAAAYNALGVASAASPEIILKNEGCAVTVNNPADTQVTHIWLYRMGGLLDGFYRVARVAVTKNTGSVDIADTTSDKDALVLNIKLETDNVGPPDNIIGITEDYYTRLLCLTSDGKVHPSRRLDPDGFSTGQQMRVGSAAETSYWIKKAFGGVYVGTSKDIYRISGDGSENPDATTNFQIVPLNINSPPISSALAWDGNILVYMAGDGPRLFSGEASSPLRGATDLLWRGYTRHEVSPVNLAGGRFRMAIANGILEILTPEGTSTTTTAVIYKYNFAQQQWYRHTYTGQQWRSIYREPDGTLLAGDNAGWVWRLEDPTATGDAATAIPVTIWSKTDDFGLPFRLKKGESVLLRLDTGGVAAGFSVYFDGGGFQVINVSPTLTGQGIFSTNLFTAGSSTLTKKFRQMGWRLTGDFTTFRFYGFTIQFVEAPESVEVFDSGPIDFQTNDIVFVRTVRLKAQTAVSLILTPYLDGVAQATQTIAPISSDVAIYKVRLGREIKTTGPRFVINAPVGSTFEPYWLECVYRAAGNMSQKRTVRIAA